MLGSEGALVSRASNSATGFRASSARFTWAKREGDTGTASDRDAGSPAPEIAAGDSATHQAVQCRWR